ncbi:hypothetical protein [Massilia oculi]|uniref:hypothetical protein n=1 Tax=Massilia oculi TaxID=945844 RepID=UPI003F8ADE5B
MAEADVPIQTLQRVKRHESFTTTMGYLKKNLDVAARAPERISATARLLLFGPHRNKAGDGTYQAS